MALMWNNSIDSYGNSNATQGFIWREIAWPPRLLERKNNNEVQYFSMLFLMFTLTPITEKRARASDWKQRRRISLEEKQENFTEAVGKWEMLAASKVKMSCSKSHNINGWFYIRVCTVSCKRVELVKNSSFQKFVRTRANEIWEKKWSGFVFDSCGLPLAKINLAPFARPIR